MLSEVNTHFFPSHRAKISQKFINSLKVLSLLLCRTSTLTLKRVLAEFKEFNLDFIFGTRATTNQFGFALEYPDVTGAADSPANTGGGRKRASKSLEGASLSRFWPPPLCAPFPVCHSPPPSLPQSLSLPSILTPPLPPPLLCPHPPPASLPTIVAASQTQCLKHLVPGIYTCQVALGNKLFSSLGIKRHLFQHFREK